MRGRSYSHGRGSDNSLEYKSESLCAGGWGRWALWITSPAFSADANNMLTLRREKPEAPSADLRMFARKEQKMIADLSEVMLPPM